MWPLGLTLAMTLTLWIFEVKYGICYISAKNGPIATKWKTNISIEIQDSNVMIRFDLSYGLDLEFSMSNMEFAISLPKMVWLPRNEKQTYRLNFRTQMWPSGLTLAMTLTLNFQGQIWNLLYLGQQCSNFDETKSIHTNWTLGLKCDQWVWHWLWPWPLNFQDQMWPWPLTTHMALAMDSCILECEGWLTLNKGGGSRSPWLWPFGEQGQV